MGAGPEGLGVVGLELHSTLLSPDGIATSRTTGGTKEKRSVEINDEIMN